LPFDPCIGQNVAAEVETISTKGLPIKYVKKKKSEVTLLEQKHNYPTEDVFECVKVFVSVKEIEPEYKLPFKHLDTNCELIFTKNTSVVCEGAAEFNVIISRPNVYYRFEGDSELFPCECLCVVEDSIYKIFEAKYKNIEERARKISIFSKLSKPQKDFLLTMAARPIQEEEAVAVEEFTPIQDLSSIEMMYEICKETYKPAVRARIEYLKAQLSNTMGSDRTDLINQMAFAVGIDTESREHPKRTYEEFMAILDKHIYGLQEVKENIVEFLIAMLESGTSYFLMLLVGPPGVGKSSIVEGVSECLGAPLGIVGCHGTDYVTASGLRSSYGGAKEGKVASEFMRFGSTDIVLLVDELDKMEKGNGMDPYSSFINTFGPQHKCFDEYVASDIDVSATKFIATANDVSKIPNYILSRFENNIFYIGEYNEDEKVEIAQNHIVPGVLNEHKINAEDCVFEEEALRFIIREYCDEEGVRELKGNVVLLIRKILTEHSRGFLEFPLCVDCDFVKSHLRKKQKEQKRRIGF